MLRLLPQIWKAFCNALKDEDTQHRPAPKTLDWACPDSFSGGGTRYTGHNTQLTYDDIYVIFRRASLCHPRPPRRHAPVKMGIQNGGCGLSPVLSLVFLPDTHRAFNSRIRLHYVSQYILVILFQTSTDPQNVNIRPAQLWSKLKALKSLFLFCVMYNNATSVWYNV